MFVEISVSENALKGVLRDFFIKKRVNVKTNNLKGLVTMTKLINKKVFLVLLTVVFSLCWLAVPASAEEVTCSEATSEHFIVESITDPILNVDGLRSEDIATPFASVDNFSVKGETFLVIPARYNSSEGVYERLMNQEYWSITGAGYTPYNCAVSHETSQFMAENGFDLVYVELVYNIQGTSTYRIELSLDYPEWVDCPSRVQGGKNLVRWMMPKTYHTYGLNVTPSSSMIAKYLGGHISIG